MNYPSAEALEVVADHCPDLAAYLPALKMIEGCTFGNAGRIKAQIWQAAFGHMLELRRQACVRTGQHFHVVELAATKAVKRLKLNDPYLEWVAVFAKTLDACDDPGPWVELRARMKVWSSS